MMTKEELAKKLDGREYLCEMTSEEMRIAKENGLVVIFGYSDDDMEFRGAIDDEVSCYDGGDTYINGNGLIENECDCDDCPYFLKQKKAAKKITAVWGDSGISWRYKTDIPHEQFNVMEDGEVYCVGIVFSMLDVMVAK